MAIPTIPPERLPPGTPPPPILAMPVDVILAGLLEWLWWNASGREQGALRQMMQPLVEWAKARYEPCPEPLDLAIRLEPE